MGNTVAQREPHGRSLRYPPKQTLGVPGRSCWSSAFEMELSVMLERAAGRWSLFVTLAACQVQQTRLRQLNHAEMPEVTFLHSRIRCPKLPCGCGLAIPSKRCCRNASGPVISITVDRSVICARNDPRTGYGTYDRSGGHWPARSLTCGSWAYRSRLTAGCEDSGACDGVPSAEAIERQFAKLLTVI